MSNATPIVTIFGGSGFVGRYIAQRMARAGWRVRVAVRRPNEAMYVKPYGDVGQVEPILCNVRNEASTRAAIAGADAVVNCVGLLQETKFQSFEDIHIDSAKMIAKLTSEAGISKLVHISSLSANSGSESSYAETIAEGDDQVLEEMPDAVILRPSVIFGTEDKFLNRIAEFSRFSPIIPVVCADTKLQPVYVDDIAAAAVKALTESVPAGIYELGGPETATLRELAKIAVDAAERRRVIISAPMWLARTKAWAFEMFEKITGGLFPAYFTRDQLHLIENDNVVGDVDGFAALGIQPTAMDSVIEDYLYHFRSSGQFNAMTDSASNLGS